MAEAGQKDQTGNEAVAVEDKAPQTLDEITGFSNGAKDGGTKPAVSQSVEKPKAQDNPPENGNNDIAAKKLPVNEQVDPEDSQEASAAKSKFFDNEWQEKLLCNAWKVDHIDAEVGKFLKGLSQDDKTGAISFKTPHGNFEWGKTEDGSEYIGRRGFLNFLTQDIADEEALVAKSRGWTEVMVHGSEANKQKLWLASMRAGLEVANYAPPENSKAFEIWKKECAEKLTGLTNAEDAPKNNAPKNDAPETPAAASAASEAPAVDKPAEAAAKADAPKTDTPATPAATAPVETTPAVDKPEEAKTDAPKTDTPATPAAAEATDTPPVVEEPKAEAPKSDAPVTPVASKFGSAEPPKPEEQKAAEPAKVNPAHAQWEKDKALFSSKPEGEEVSREGRMNVEAVEGMSKRAATVQDPIHREGIEKLQDAIKSGKVKVEGPIEREIINNVDSPKGFQKAADYFSNKAGGDLGLPKAAAPAAAENTAPKNTAPKNKGPA